MHFIRKALIAVPALYLVLCSPGSVSMHRAPTAISSRTDTNAVKTKKPAKQKPKSKPPVLPRPTKVDKKELERMREDERQAEYRRGLLLREKKKDSTQAE